jgi:hypothetical protein
MEGAEPKGEPAAEPKEAAPKKDEEPKAEEEKEPDGPAAKGWAAVRRVEQKLIKKQKEFDARAQEITAKAQQLDAKLKEIQEREALLDSDPIAYLNKRGLSFDDVAKRYLNNGAPSPEEAAKRAAAQGNDALKAQEERLARIESLIQQREAQAAVNQYRADVKETIAADEFELLRAWPDAEAEVLDFADKWAARHKQVLTPRDAAAKLQGELQKQLKHLSSHQAVRSLLTSAGNGALKQAVSGQSQAPRGNPGASPKTLTNNLAATPPAEEPDFDSLSEEDQIQAALRLVQG